MSDCRALLVSEKCLDNEAISCTIKVFSSTEYGAVSEVHPEVRGQVTHGTLPSTAAPPMISYAMCVSWWVITNLGSTLTPLSNTHGTLPSTAAPPITT